MIKLTLHDGMVIWIMVARIELFREVVGETYNTQLRLIDRDGIICVKETVSEIHDIFLENVSLGRQLP